ncbi:hypothetical protein BKA57DRAFT_509211 [Linnemannia elongata]|nr:hypothetical protein BKA57DRAFT_509211 [Linnemannia elongata]
MTVLRLQRAIANKYQGIFSTHNLFKLYKISYEPLGGHTLDWFNGFPSIFYHGTGHCGCLQRRNSTPDSGEIRASEWCGTAACPTLGILNYGCLKVRSPRAQSYAYCKSDSQVLLSVFLVKTRSLWPPNQVTCFVHRDMTVECSRINDIMAHEGDPQRGGKEDGHHQSHHHFIIFFPASHPLNTNHHHHHIFDTSPTLTIISLKDPHLEPLALTSAMFMKYLPIFGADRLAKMHKIVYRSASTHTLDQFNGFPSL